MSLELSFPDEEDYDLSSIFMDSQESKESDSTSLFTKIDKDDVNMDQELSSSEESESSDVSEDSGEDGDEEINNNILENEPLEFDFSDEQLSKLTVVPDAPKVPVRVEIRKEKKTKKKEKPKRKVARSKWVRVTKALTEEATNQHKVHILFWLAHHRFVYSFVSNESIQSIILSLLPTDMMDSIKKRRVGRKRKSIQSPEQERMIMILNWFHENFEILKMENTDSSLNLYEDDIIKSIQDKKINLTVANIIVAVVCSFCGITARYIGIIEPITVHVKGSSIEHAGLEREKIEITKEHSEKIINQINIGYCWLEFLDVSENDWISINIYSKEINKPLDFELNRMLLLDNSCCNIIESSKEEDIESPKKRAKRISPKKSPNIRGVKKNICECEHKGCIYYAIALYDNMMFDVSWRYSGDWLHAKRNRMLDPSDIDWWNDTLEIFIKPGNDYEEMVNIDTKLRDEIESSIPLPNTLVGFQKHPLYCLEKQVGKYQAIYPPTIVTKFRDQNIYLRSNLHNLHSADKWLQKGRVVIDDDSDDAIKQVDSIKSFIDPFGQHEQTKLYGRWQTKVFEPPEVKEGEKIPRNEYGNVYLFFPWMIPVGTVHLKLHNSVSK